MALDQVFTLAQKHAQRSNEVGERSMSLGEHLEELRHHLLHALYGVALAAGIAFYYAGDIIGWILDPMIQALHRNGYPASIISTGPSAGFGEYMTVGLIMSAILASPWIVWQLWKFIATGLYPRERKVAHILVPFSSIMTLWGSSFAYFILLPICLNFFISFSDSSFPKPHPGQLNPVSRWIYDANDWIDKKTPGMPWGSPKKPDAVAPQTIAYDAAPIKLPILSADPKQPARGDAWINGVEGSVKITVSDGHVVTLAMANDHLITPMPNLSDYISFAAFMILAVAIAFQIPVVMLVIGWTRLLNPDFFAGKRKFALLACAVGSALLTPSTDMFSMLLLALPMYGLFEGGLILMRWAYNTQQRKAEDNLEGDDLL